MHTTAPAQTQEIPRRARSGWFMLAVTLALFLGSGWLLVACLKAPVPLWPCLGGALGILAGWVSLGGFFTLQPNEARVLLLFGRYCGTVRQSGFLWANPFYSASRSSRPASGASGDATPHSRIGTRISLKARNFLSEKLKVNDKRGNPVEIAAVVVWRIADTAKATFDVENVESYVQIQSEAAIRHIASLYSYDRSDEDAHSLRDSADVVAQALRAELQTRLERAGVTFDDARLTHLAYAPEIAQSMLRRQQAEAVIAAREKIVQGAVSMVHMALQELAEKEVVALDEERKAAMVSNLLVVLCSESNTTPVLNTGTLYP